MRPPKLDWPLLAGLGMGVLGWPPDRFWAATPVELRLALQGRFPARRRAALDSNGLVDLQARFPDG